MEISGQVLEEPRVRKSVRKRSDLHTVNEDDVDLVSIKDWGMRMGSGCQHVSLPRRCLQNINLIPRFKRIKRSPGSATQS